MADSEVLEVDGGNPLATRFDDVLGAVGDLHVAVTVDGGDVAGVEEALRVEDVPLLFIVGARHAWSPHLESSEGLAVPREPPAGIVGDLHLDHERALSLLLLNVEPRVPAERRIFRLERAGGGQRTHFGHAPSMAPLPPLDTPKRFLHC